MQIAIYNNIVIYLPSGEIGSVAWAVFNLSSPLPTFLIQKFGSRVVAALGVLMCGSGLLLSTLSKQIWMLFVFYGVVQGLGLCFVQMASLQLLTCYFSGSALVRALSVAALGETIGEFSSIEIKLLVIILLHLNTYVKAEF